MLKPIENPRNLFTKEVLSNQIKTFSNSTIETTERNVLTTEKI